MFIVCFLVCFNINGADSRSNPVTATYCDNSTLDIYPYSFVTRGDGSTFNCYEVLVEPYGDGLKYMFEDSDDGDYNDIVIKLWVSGQKTSAPVLNVKYLSGDAAYKHWIYVVYNGTQQLVFRSGEQTPGATFTVPLPTVYCADFAFSALPASQTVYAGESTQYTMTLHAIEQFASPVQFSLRELPTGVTASFSVNPALPAPTAESILDITTTADTPPGTYSIFIKAEGGGILHTRKVTLIVNEPLPDADFSIIAVPGTRTVSQGESTTYNITLTAIEGFSENVKLVVPRLPRGTTVTFSHGRVTPDGESLLAVTTSASTPVGTHTLNITATSGDIKHTAPVKLKVTEKPPEPDFTIDAEPLTRTVSQGESTDFQINVSPINGFAEDVKLTVQGLPSNASAQFQPDTLQPEGTSTLTVTTTEETPVGNVTLTVTGTGGGITHNAAITLTTEEKPPDPDFTLTAAPMSRTILRGESAEYTLTVTALNGFSEEVSLSTAGLPDGTTAQLTPSAVTAEGQSTLQITTSHQTPTGTHTFTVTGKSGELQHSVTLTLIISCPGFTLQINAEPRSGSAPLTVQMEAEITSKSDFPITAYGFSWDFGDGSTSDLQDPEHLFQAPGNYTVSLTVTDPCGNTQTAAITVEVEGFEGSLTKRFSIAEAAPGDEVTITIEARNDTRYDFNTIFIEDELSPLLEYIEDDASVTPRRSGRELVWQFPGLKSGETQSINIKVKVSETAPAGTVTNTAYLIHDSLGPGKRITSNTASLTVNAIRVTLLKQVEQTEAQPGDTVKYQLTVKNNSNIPLTNLTLTDQLPSQLEFLSQTGEFNFSSQGRTLQWTGTLDALRQAVIILKGKIGETVFSGTRIENTAKVEAAELKEPVTSNTVVTTVTSEPITTTKVRFTLRSEVPQTEVGRIIRFNASVVNMSNSPLIAPVIEIHLPQGFNYVDRTSLLNNQRFIEPQGKRRPRWEIPDIAANGTATLRYQVVIGTDARRGRNINRATLRALDTSGQDLFYEASAFVNVSSSGFIFYSGVEGTVYLDRDGDDFYSVTDTPMENIEVRMSTGEKAVTDAMGHYAFENLFPGEYAVGINRVTLPEKYRAFIPVPKVVVLADGLTDTADFAIVYNRTVNPFNAHVEGRVFLDKNKNQVYDQGEPLLSTFKAFLDGKTLNMGTNGKFMFSRIRPGPHTLSIKVGGTYKEKTVQLKKGKNTIDFPLKYSALRIKVTGEK